MKQKVRDRRRKGNEYVRRGSIGGEIRVKRKISMSGNKAIQKLAGRNHDTWLCDAPEAHPQSAEEERGRLSAFEAVLDKGFGGLYKMTKLFISYARNDMVKIHPVTRELEELGFVVWMDVTRIKGGKNWGAEIVKAITECDYFLLFISSTSIEF